MKLFLFIFSILSFINLQAQNLYPTLHDQSGGISSGYGSWGTYGTIKETPIDVAGKGTISFYHPIMTPTQLGTVIFISGWGREASTYESFFHYLASLGYSVINIYNTNPGSIENSYANSVSMILESATTHYPDWIDTTKIGLMGHSYGGGSTIWIGKELFGPDHNWGTNGRFIFLTAPWLSFLVDKDDLQNYPENVKLLIEISNDDLSTDASYTWNTDERAIRAIYELINIPDDEKDFIRVYSDPTTFIYDGNNYTYNASHYVSYTGTVASDGNFQTYDAMDVYALNRLAHALIDYVFNGIEDGKAIALGNGSSAQIDMGGLTELSVTDKPVISRPEEDFKYQCSATSGWGDPAIWKLQNYCIDTDNDGVIDFLKVESLTQNLFKVYPVPTTSLVNIRFVSEFEKIERIEILNSAGSLVTKIIHPNTYTLNLSELNTGTYFIKIETLKHFAIQKIILVN